MLFLLYLFHKLQSIFTGSVSRTQFLVSVLTLAGIFVALEVTYMIAAYSIAPLSQAANLVVSYTFFVVGFVYFIALLVYGLGTAIRRTRSAGISPWWNLLLLIPYLGLIYLVYLMAAPGKATASQ